MSDTANIRARIRALLAGTAGSSPFTIAAARGFSPVGNGETLEQVPTTALERRFEVQFRDTDPLFRPDPMARRRYDAYTLTIRVGYVVGNATLTYDANGMESGSSDLESVEDRAQGDRRDIENCLGCGSSVLDCLPLGTSAGGGGLVVFPDRAILSVQFLCKVFSAIPNAASTPSTP